MIGLMHRSENGRAQHAQFAPIASEVRCRSEADTFSATNPAYWTPLNRVASVDDLI